MNKTIWQNIRNANMNFDMGKYRRKIKFWGKLITYFSIVLAIFGAVKGDLTITSTGLFFITVGCSMHEFSET
jgi:hypothetical protein